MMDTLTVRENFHFSASLRLPSHMTRQQRKERVEKVIDELGLTKCADTKVTSLSLSLSLSLTHTHQLSHYVLCPICHKNCLIYNVDDIQHRISMYVDWE